MTVPLRPRSVSHGALLSRRGQSSLRCKGERGRALTSDRTGRPSPPVSPALSSGRALLVSGPLSPVTRDLRGGPCVREKVSRGRRRLSLATRDHGCSWTAVRCLGGTFQMLRGTTAGPSRV